MGDIRIINPAAGRYKKNARKFMQSAVDCSNLVDNKISGYVIMAWDDTGATSHVSKAGGIISTDAMPVHVLANLLRSDIIE
jgi:hypothetical protein